MKVLLIAVQDSAAHYQLVLRKLGCGGPSRTGDTHVVIESMASSDSSWSTPEQPGALQELLTRALYAVQAPGRAWREFILQLLHLQACSKDMCLATLVHRDTDGGARWARLVEHAAHVVVDVQPLPSGHSLEASGQLVIRQRAAAGASLSRVRA
ncbi:hypothetical protein WJX81_002076 [Elliptochloris bilobata]|uniref:Uncharacterized protein n=1 Tax=Elliptochloris bilobata TaxID=381761 RepID=A0AAW1QXE6_9CHLO